MPSAPLDVVIVSYRCEALLRDCLASLRDHPPGRGCASTSSTTPPATATAEMVRREFPEVELTEQPSEPRLQRRQQHRDRRAATPPTCSCLNPDTRITPGALDALLELMDDRPEVGIVGPAARARGRQLRPRRRAARSPPRSARSGTSPGSGAGRALRAPRRLPRAGGRVRTGRRGQRRLHADPPRGARAGRRSSTRATGCTWRTSTSATASPQAGWVTWYEPSVTRHPRQGRDQRHEPLAAAQLRLPLRHVPLLPHALRAADSTPANARGLRRDRR